MFMEDVGTTTYSNSPLTPEDCALLRHVSKIQNQVVLQWTTNGIEQMSNLVDRVHYAASSAYRSRIDQGINSRIKTLVTNIATNLEKFSDEQLRQIFFETLSHVDERQFQRGDLPDNVIERLRRIVEPDPSIGLQQPGGPVKPSEEYANALLEVKLSLALDAWKRPKIPSGGTSLVGIFTDYKGKCRLVIKPVGYGPASGKTVASLLKKWRKVIIRPSLPSEGELQAEITATHFARLLKVSSIAETHSVKVTQDIGRRFFAGINADVEASAQLHVESTLPEGTRFGLVKDELSMRGFRGLIKSALYAIADRVTGGDHERNIRFKEGIDDFLETFLFLSKGLDPKTQIDEIQKFWLMDYIMGNLDRHEENWFLKSCSTTGQVTGLVGIDQGACFYLRHPDSYFNQRNQYAWKSLKESRLPFGSEAKKLAQKTIDLKNQLIAAINLHMKNLTQDERSQVIDCLEERLDAIEGVANGHIGTPYDLASKREKADFNT